MSPRSSATGSLDAAIAVIDGEVARWRADGSIPGLALAVTDRDGLLIDRVYGDAEVASGRPVRHDTLFEIGSIGKTFTALVLMQHAEEGRLDLDDPVVRHLPWFRVPRTGSRITIRHLMSHTAGITAGIDGTPEPTFQVWRLRDLSPGCAPGRRYHYSNLGYKTLGLVIEAIEGERYPEVIRRRILDPLGMTGTEPEITNEIRARLAVGYEPARDDRLWFEGAPLLPATWLETATADGCLAANGADMATFARMLMRRGEAPGGRLVSADAIDLMATPVKAIGEDGYGHGLITWAIGGHRYTGHTGGMVGYIAGMWCDLDEGLGAVVLQNGPGHSPFALSRIAIRAVAAVRAGREPQADAGGVFEHDDVSSFAGAYDGPDGRTFRTTAEGGRLRLENGEHHVATTDFGGGSFLVEDDAWDRALLSFESGGEVAWHGGERSIRRGSSAPALGEPSPAVRSIAGTYRSHDPWATNFRVVLRGDVPWLCFMAAPDGFEGEQPLRPYGRGGYRVGDDPLGPERLRFDTVIDGRATRAWLSGWDYYRVDDA